MSEIERDGFSAREMYLMRQAHEAGRCAGEGETLDTWLDETISDAGHYVAQHLAHDAERLYGDVNPEYTVDRHFLVELLADRNKRIDRLELQLAQAAPAQRAGSGEAVLYRYRVIDDPQGWEYSTTPLFGPESGPGPKEEYQILNLDQVCSELNDAHPQPAQQGSVPGSWRVAVKRAVDELSIMDESEGIAGFHLNGDVSPWHEGELPNVRDELKVLLSATPQPEGDNWKPDLKEREVLRKALLKSSNVIDTEGDGWLAEVAAERRRQDQKWGGPEHDDQKSPNDFVQHIEDYAGWARVMAGMDSFDKYRRRMIQVAALAGAAVEAVDRALARANPPAGKEGK